MKINSDRLLSNLYTLREFTDTPGRGVTRFSYTPSEAKAREYIIKRAENAGCQIHIDSLQNIHISLKCNRAGCRTVVAGSHIDTVKNGGWLDGIYGVCGALEVMETLSENIHDTQNPVTTDGEALLYNFQLTVFAEEEGSNFGSTMTGSKFIAGIYEDEDLDRLRDDTGRTLRDALLSLNDIPDSDECRTPLYNRNPIDVSDIKWNFDNIKAMLELHIEQGPVLDRDGLAMGIVQSIFGMRVIEVTITGVGNHAGATPMNQRHDALMASCEAMLSCETLIINDPDKRTVVTMGKLDVLPNQSNVIPETVRFSLEVRDKDEAKIDRFTDACIDAIKCTCKSRGVACEIKEHSRSSPLYLDKRIIEDMTCRAEETGLKFKVMDSGAVHDACMIAYKSPTGMIFAPSINGRSHVPQENTNAEDLVSCAQFLMDTVLCELTNT